MTALEPAAPLAADSPLHRFDVWLAEAAHAADELAAQGDLDGLALWLAQARHMRRSLGDIERILEDHTATLMRTKRYEHPTLGVLERRKGADRKNWDWEALRPAVFAVLLTRHEGSVLDALDAFFADVFTLTPSKAPKLSGVRNLHLDPDEFCEVSPGRTSVQIMGDVVAAERREAVAEATYEHVESVNDGPAQEWGTPRLCVGDEEPF